MKYKSAKSKPNKYPLWMLFVILLFIIPVGFLIGKSGDIFPDDSKALYGGKFESNYPSAGYIIGKLPDAVTLCGSVAINSNTIVTAAHCIEENSTLLTGIGHYKYISNDHIPALFSEKISNLTSNKIINDIAFIKLEREIETRMAFGEIAEPKIGCNYEIVAYGTTEDKYGDPKKRIRKSVEVCVTGIEANLIYFQSASNGGLCHGDSGSPIFEKSTNRVVGVASAITSINTSADNVCDFNNKGVAISLARNEELIQAFVAGESIDNPISFCGSSCESSIDCANGLLCIADTCQVSATETCAVNRGGFCSDVSNIQCVTGDKCSNNQCVIDNEAANTFTNLQFPPNNIPLQSQLDKLGITRSDLVIGIGTIIIAGILYLLINKTGKR